jgi:Domain of unknown function (DUF4386)
MMEPIADASPGPRARITGAVYLLYFLTAILGQFLASRKGVYGDAVNLISDAFYIAVTLLFYEMFKPVNRGVSLVAALFSLVGCAIMILDLFHLAPSHLSPLLFFAPYCLLLGYLIFRSTFLPRILGVLMVLAGLGWLMFLSPPLAKHLSLYIEILGVLAEGLLMLWLLVKGVNVSRWKEQAKVRTVF